MVEFKFDGGSTTGAGSCGRGTVTGSIDRDSVTFN